MQKIEDLDLDLTRAMVQLQNGQRNLEDAREGLARPVLATIARRRKRKRVQDTLRLLRAVRKAFALEKEASDLASAGKFVNSTKVRDKLAALLAGKATSDREEEQG